MKTLIIYTVIILVGLFSGCLEIDSGELNQPPTYYTITDIFTFDVERDNTLTIYYEDENREEGIYETRFKPDKPSHFVYEYLEVVNYTKGGEWPDSGVLKVWYENCKFPELCIRKRYAEITTPNTHILACNWISGNVTECERMEVECSNLKEQPYLTVIEVGG